MKSTKKFYCYASGSGALSFAWRQGDISLRQAERTYSVGTVTLAQVEHWLNTSTEGKRLKAKGYRSYFLVSHPVIAEPMTRIDENHVKLLYNDSERVVEYAPGEWFKVKVWTEDPDLGRVEIKHLSTLMGLRFWLEHEEEMAKQDAARVEKQYAQPQPKPFVHQCTFKSMSPISLGLTMKVAAEINQERALVAVDCHLVSDQLLLVKFNSTVAVGDLFKGMMERDIRSIEVDFNSPI